MKLKKVLKSGFFSALMVVIGFQVACGDPLTEIVTDEEQLEVDIEDMENYLADNGYNDFDTLDFDVRALILEEGDGEEIEYGDIVNYHYIGRFLDGEIFDTTYPDLAFKQDTANTDSLVFELDDNDNFVLDINGLPSIEYVEYYEDYIPIYRASNLYSTFITTHTPEGWFIRNEGGYAEGFALGAHFTFERVNLGGSGLVLIPDQVGSSRFGDAARFIFLYGRQAVSFEIRPVRKH